MANLMSDLRIFMNSFIMNNKEGCNEGLSYK